MSALPSTAIAGITPDNTIGALLFGGIIGAILYGIISMQAATYYHGEHHDGWLIQTAVPLLWSLGTIDMCLIFHFLYSYLILNYGDFGSVTQEAPLWSINLHIFVIILTQTVVRSLFAARIRKLCQSWIPVLAICTLSLADLFSSIALTIKGTHEKFVGLGTSDRTFDALVCVNFATSFAGDALVAVCLCYLLQRSRTGFGKTESMIKTLVAYVVTTGLLTTIVQSVALILFILSSKNFVYLAVLTQVSKLYVNAYLAMLNDRERIRELGGVTVPISRLQTEVVHSSIDVEKFTTSKSMEGNADISFSSVRSGSDVSYVV